MSTEDLTWPLVHKKLASTCFNATWDILDLAERTPEQEEEMLRLTFASHYHWTKREDYRPVKASIAHWQVSRVFAVIGSGELALRFGRRALEAAQSDAEMPAFALAYAHEAIARAAHLLGDAALRDTHAAKVRAMIADVDEKTQPMLEADLATIG